jgi:hypothetical protein
VSLSLGQQEAFIRQFSPHPLDNKRFLRRSSI